MDRRILPKLFLDSKRKLNWILPSYALCNGLILLLTEDERYLNANYRPICANPRSNDPTMNIDPTTVVLMLAFMLGKGG